MRPDRTAPATAALLGLVLALALGSPAAAADKPIQGTVRYLDAFYDYTPSPSGLAVTDLWRPVRQAEVEVSNGTETKSTTTDGTGAYAVTLSGSGTLDVTVTVYARRLGTKVNARVLRSDDTQYTVTATSPGADFESADPLTADLDVGTSTPEHRAAFNIFDTAVIGFEFLDALASGSLADPPLLTLHWQAGSTQGTYMDTDDNSIWLLGSSSDNDAYDDDIILHEMGHYISVNFAKDDSPGGAHSLTGRYVITLTWSEGWAHFWSAAARRWADAAVAPSGRYPDARWQIDTSGAGGFSAWDIGGPSYPLQTTGADNEVSVAALLWDIATPAGAADDGALGLDADEIWAVVSTTLAARNTLVPPDNFVTLEDFFDEWRKAGHDDLATVLAARAVLYVTDPLDTAPASNDDRLTATVLDPLPAAGTATIVAGNTLFKSGSEPVGDEDWFSFTAAALELFRVETTGLGDGADTYLRVYDAALTQLAFDDDAGAGTASYLTFTAPADGVYYVKVASYPGDGPYPAADQLVTYGSYTLSITSDGVAAPPSSDHHHRSGSIGIDLMAPAALLWLLRRRRDRRRGSA
jgi:hypothetical protein